MNLKGHVLVVDDLETNRDALARMLEREGLTTAVAQDGLEALECMRQTDFDAVLLDVMMPRLDGIQTLTVMKREEALRDIPVIMLSALNEARAIRECIELGADDYLPKPIDRSLLRARLSSCLRRKELLDREKAHLQRLEATNEELRRLGQLKSRFLATAAHDLKNPLTTVLILLEQITEAAGSSEGGSTQRRHAGRIRDSVNRMLGIIQAILDSAVHEAGDLPLSLGPVDLSGLARTVVEDNRDYAHSKQIHLSLQTDSQGVVALADPSRMRDVLDNLVNNAIKFSPTQRRVEVRVGRYGPRARIEVQDEGPGLTEDDLRQAFTPYQRLSARPTGNEVSTGLGLSIVKHLVDLQHGTVKASGSPGQGATFTVELPLLEG